MEGRHKEHRETSGNGEEVDFDVTASRKHNVSKLIKTHMLNMDSVLFFNYTPNTVQSFFKKNFFKALAHLGLFLLLRTFLPPLGGVSTSPLNRSQAPSQQSADPQATSPP